VSDYLQPAFEAGTLDRKLEPAMGKSLKVCQKKAAQQDKEISDEDDDEDVVDDEETETDDSSAENEKEQKKPQHKAGKASHSAATSKRSPKKVGKTKAKPKMDDLVAAIQNKRGGGGSLFASLGARYGVNMEQDDDPLGGDKFERAQSKMLQKGKGGRKKK
jgi:hypothetical protein